MKITSVAENMVYWAWCGWRAFALAVLRKTGFGLVRWIHCWKQKFLFGW